MYDLYDKAYGDYSDKPFSELPQHRVWGKKKGKTSKKLLQALEDSQIFLV